MLDITLIRQSPEALDLSLARRSLAPMAQEIVALDVQRRALQTQSQALQTERNRIAKQFGEAKRRGEPTESLAQRAEQIKENLATLGAELVQIEDRLHGLLSMVPNWVAPECPDGVDETGNIELRRVGDVPSFNFDPQPHFVLGEASSYMNFEVATKLAGSRFVVLFSDLARLERALAAFMLDVHTREFGYTEVSPPLLVNEKTMFGTGQLPKFQEDQFQTTTGYWLIPTAEVVLTNLVAGDILVESVLPLRFTAYTPCFRLEAGAAGRDTRGMIRQHQFGKVELVSITTAEQAALEHERMVYAAETILQRLKLPYRVVALCAGDLGFSAQKTFDIEVWLPSQQTYREISSCSDCGDFQARRMNARYKVVPTGQNPKPTPQFVHTLNGSGVAVGRALVAILENYQEEDGSIRIPEVLVPYMGGIERILSQ